MSLLFRYLAVAYLICSLLIVVLFSLWQQQEKKTQLQLFLQQYSEIIALHLRPTLGQLSGEQLLQQLAELQFSALLPISAVGLYQQQGNLIAASGQLEALPTTFNVAAYNQFTLYQDGAQLWAVYPLRSHMGLADQFIPVYQTAAWLVIVPEQTAAIWQSVFPAATAWSILTLFLGVTLFLWRLQHISRHASVAALQQRLQNFTAEEVSPLPEEFSALEPVLSQQMLELQNRAQQQQILQSQLKHAEQQAQDVLASLTQSQLHQAERQQQFTHWLHQLDLLWLRREQLDEPCFQALWQLHQVYAAEAFAQRQHNMTPLLLQHWLPQRMPDYTALLAESLAIDWLEGANTGRFQLHLDPVHLDAIFSAMLLVGLRSDSARRLLFRVNLETAGDPQLVLQLNVDGNGLPGHLLSQSTATASKDWLWRDIDLTLLRLLAGQLQAKLDIASLDGLGVSISLILPVTVEAISVTEQLGQVLLFDTDPERLAERLALLNGHALKVATCHSFTDLPQRIQQQHYDAIIIMLPGQLPNAEWQQFLLNSSRPVITYAQPFTYDAWRKVSLCYSSNTFSLSQLAKAIQQQPTRQPKKLLVVDDNETNQAFIKILLQSKPVAISAAYTGVQALSLCQSQQFDMVLLDIRLPDQSGVKVAQQLRQLAGYQKIPVLAFTAHALADEIAEFKTAGMDDILLKPLDPCKFDRLLSTYRLY